jgi:lysophospholipid acyltransferase (LPLAT)-like uncharacterized protein
MTKLKGNAAGSLRLETSCDAPSPVPSPAARGEKGTPAAPSRARKPFSLTRARPSGRHLSRADRMRAAVFSAAVRGTIWAIAKTVRLRTTGEEAVARYRSLGPGNLLFAMWHGDYFPVFSYARGSNVCVVVSRSPDGEILARLLDGYGYRTVRGSNTRGGTRALINLARVVKSGCDAAIAVDGPRGPAGVAKPGIILLSKMTGCPIVPLGVGMSRCKRFASWDRFGLPLPFSRAVIAVGEAVEVPADATTELIKRERRRLEASLSTLQATARDLVDDHFDRADRPPGFAASRTPAR